MPGDMATFTGLAVSAKAEVLGRHGLPIPGLYAVGNDAANVFAGACVGGGITIGPAMVFGFIAANALQAASRAK
jgi:predicted oxidoreductase